MPMGNSLQCTSTSKKLYVLVEPPSYNEKYVEPVHRKEEESIPYRESELEIIKTFDQTRITIAKEPVNVPASFTIIKPAGFNFSVVFYKLPDIYQTLAAFFKQSLVGIVEKNMSFKNTFV